MWKYIDRFPPTNQHSKVISLLCPLLSKSGANIQTQDHDCLRRHITLHIFIQLEQGWNKRWNSFIENIMNDLYYYWTSTFLLLKIKSMLGWHKTKHKIHMFYFSLYSLGNYEPPCIVTVKMITDDRRRSACAMGKRGPPSAHAFYICSFLLNWEVNCKFVHRLLLCLSINVDELLDPF